MMTSNYLRLRKLDVPRNIKTALRVGRPGEDKKVWVDLQELSQYEQVEYDLIEKKREGKV